MGWFPPGGHGIWLKTSPRSCTIDPCFEGCVIPVAKTCTNEKTAARQRWIENGLLELMQDTSFEQVTVTDLCHHLCFSRRSFYRYFRDMEDVLDSMLNHTFQDMAISDSALTIPALEEYYAFWLRRKNLLSALARSGMHGKITQYALKYADEESLKKHLSDEDPDLTREMNLFIISGLSALLISWHADGFQKTPRQMAQIAQRMLSRPLFPNL